jgi:transposase
LLEYFPALERAFDYAHRKAALVLLTGYQTPDALRRMGATRLEKWLRDRHAYNAGDLAARAIAAANSQRTVVAGEHVAATVVARLAQSILHLDAELADVDAMIEQTFHQHRLATIIVSMPGFGSLLGAELRAATNGDLSSFNTADRLAGVAGLAPVPRDSGRITGNLKRPRRYDRRLLRVFYLAANNSIKTCPESRSYYDRKRSEGKRHSQAVLCLARRRLNVLWAMQRDNTRYQPEIPRAA